MNLLISEISVSLIIAFLIGCLFMWLWRGYQMKRLVAETERQATQRGQYEMSGLRTEMESLNDEITQLRSENDQLNTRVEEHANPVLIAASAEESESLRAKLKNLDDRYNTLHTRWERERTQFAQLVAHKNSRIAALENQSASGEHAVIEDGAAAENDEDNRSYSRQQLETMLVELRTQVADQESELNTLKASQAETTQAAPVGFLGNGNGNEQSLRDSLAAKDSELLALRNSLSRRDDGTRIIEIERERAELLHRVSELNGLRATDAEHTATLHRDIETLRSDISTARAELEERNRTLDAATQTQDTLQAELTTAKQAAERIPELDARCERLQGDISTLQLMIDSANAERDAARSDASSVQSTLSSFQQQGSEASRLRAEKKALLTDLNAMQETLNSESRNAELREQQIRRAQTELAELRPLQHQLINLRGSLGDLVDRDSKGDHATVAHSEVESLRTRVAQLQADSKLDLERKESYYQELLRKKTAQISDLQNRIGDTEPAV